MLFDSLCCCCDIISHLIPYSRIYSRSNNVAMLHFFHFPLKKSSSLRTGPFSTWLPDMFPPPLSLSFSLFYFHDLVSAPKLPARVITWVSPFKLKATPPLPLPLLSPPSLSEKRKKEETLLWNLTMVRLVYPGSHFQVGPFDSSPFRFNQH